MAKSTHVVEVVVKSYIAYIGNNVGALFPPGLPGGILRANAALQALSRVTDLAFDEDPRTAQLMATEHRLYSRCRFTADVENKKVVSVAASPLVTDVGMEGPLKPPGLIVSPVHTGVSTNGVVSFSWSGKGRPHAAAEPSFQAVMFRTSVYIWHDVSGRIDFSTGAPVTTIDLKGSRFPSHRVFVDGKITKELNQGVFSNLWSADPKDLFRVR